MPAAKASLPLQRQSITPGDEAVAYLRYIQEFVLPASRRRIAQSERRLSESIGAELESSRRLNGEPDPPCAPPARVLISAAAEAAPSLRGTPATPRENGRPARALQSEYESAQSARPVPGR